MMERGLAVFHFSGINLGRDFTIRDRMWVLRLQQLGTTGLDAALTCEDAFMFAHTGKRASLRSRFHCLLPSPSAGSPFLSPSSLYFLSPSLSPPPPSPWPFHIRRNNAPSSRYILPLRPPPFVLRKGGGLDSSLRKRVQARPLDALLSPRAGEERRRGSQRAQCSLCSRGVKHT